MKSFFGYPPRLFGYAVAIAVLALPVLVGAATGPVLDGPDADTLAGGGLFLVCALVAETKPVPLDVERKRLVSLAFIFVIAAQTLLGWEYGVLVGALAIAGAQVVETTPFLRLVFNSAVYALASAAASLGSALVVPRFRQGGDVDYGLLTSTVFLQGAIFVTLNVALVCVAIAFAEGKRPRLVMADHLRHSGPAFLIMGFMAALAATLWTVNPSLLVLLAGPLLTLGLYQRYALSTRVAEHAATTDSLTGLMNHRAYKEAVQVAVERASEESPVSLCLVDVDDFKRINDTHGHPRGDAVLIELAAVLETAAAAGFAFRLGGDEFALLVDGGGDVASAAVEGLRRRLDESSELGVTVSAGIACCPEAAADADELQRVADLALYWTKRHGKNRWCHYSPTLVELSWPAEIAATAASEARFRAAENLIRVVDARDTYAGRHSEAVSRIARAIGAELGFQGEALEHLRLAALLHDLGKIAIPDAILQKPMQLSAEEAAVIRRHPEIGRDLLKGLDVAPVDEWILRHHEHWDGSGYPDGLAGDAIPVGARIILVADAFDAITSDRSYRRASPADVALEELERGAGRQFDPMVVRVLRRLLRAEFSVLASASAAS